MKENKAVIPNIAIRVLSAPKLFFLDIAFLKTQLGLKMVSEENKQEQT